jgi:hypothetical protein
MMKSKQKQGMMGTSMGGAMTKDKEEKDTMNMMGGGYMKYNYGGKVKKMKKGGYNKTMKCPRDGVAMKGKTRAKRSK